MRHKAYFSGLPTSQELATQQLGLFTKPELEAWPSCSLESTGMGGVGLGGWVDEMQNKAVAGSWGCSWGLAELGKSDSLRETTQFSGITFFINSKMQAKTSFCYF